jgi:6-pyruvoyltetrahydropterin/6-carboxytetrahydropterin synthase
MSEEFWVMDFGGLKDVKDWLAHMFDHTFLIADSDPYLEKFEQMNKDGIIQLRVMPNPGMEGSAKYIYEHVNKMIHESTNGRVWVTKVEVRENEKNSAFYQPK